MLKGPLANNSLALNLTIEARESEKRGGSDYETLPMERMKK